MTIVIGKRNHSEALMLADTKITNPSSTQTEVIPGRLKIVVIDDCFSVGFAGAADPAVYALRETKEHAANRSFDKAISGLRKWSQDYDIDFIVAMHQPEFEFYVIRRGALVEIDDLWAIGDTEPVVALLEKDRISEDGENLGKCQLRSDFIDFLTREPSAARGDLNRGSIGGVPTTLIARPSGHRYLGHTAVGISKFPSTPNKNGTFMESLENVLSGDGHYRYSTIPPAKAGVPVLGLCLPQARIGYIYSPIESSDPTLVPLSFEENWLEHEPIMYDKFREEVDDFAENLL